jgi:phage tail sheath gpL-like
MPISFNQIPGSWKQPLYWVEVDGSKAGPTNSQPPGLLVGTKMTVGVAVPDVPIVIGSQSDADHQFGIGSELAAQFRAFFANNTGQEIWALPVAEPSGGSIASATITVATPPTEAGTYHLYIGGQHIAVNVAAGDTAIEVAANIAEEINAVVTLPVVAATPTTAVVTINSRWKGILANDISLLDNYYGKVGGEQMPAGMTVTYSGATLAGGAGVPAFTNALANLGEQAFEYVSLPYTDSTSLQGWETEYGFSDTGRWGWMRQLFGHLFSAKRGLYSDLITWGATRNGRVLSALAVEPDSPTPVWAWSAAYAGKAARALSIDPAQPLQTLHLETVLPAPLHLRFNLGELNTLSGHGLATQRTEGGDPPMLARETTTYQFNAYGQPDDAFELVTTLATLAKLIRNQRNAITTKYGRHKLADDGTRFGAGQAIVTPAIIKAELIAQYAGDQFLGLTENLRAFKDALIVERNVSDPNRLDVNYPPDLVNQMRVFAVLAQFRLQYNRGIDVDNL